MEKNVTRRGFINRAVSFGAAGLTAAGLCVCALSGCLHKDRTPPIPAKYLEIKEDRVVVDVRQIAVLAKVGGAAKFNHPKSDQRIIVIHQAVAQFLALSGHCTHRGRPLEYKHASKQLRCINYGHSRFSLEGMPVQGPAQRSLQVYRTLYLGGRLEVFL